MKLTQDFKQDFKTLTDAVERMEPFGFARFGPAESFMVEYRRALATGSGWMHPGGKTRYTKAMREAIRARRENYYVGVPCPCCNPVQYAWELPRIRAPKENQTYHTIFMNSNYKPALEWFKSVRSRCVLVGCAGNCDIIIPRDAAAREWDYSDVVRLVEKSMLPVLIAGGPIANLVINAMRKFNCPVVDIGSLADTILFGHPTRAFHRTKHHRYEDTENGRLKKARTERMVDRVCEWKIAERAIHAN